MSVDHHQQQSAWGVQQLNLYRVELQGMQISVTGPRYGTSYVVAPDPTTAYNMVREFCDKADLGYPAERALKSVILLAECTRYPDCGTLLFTGHGPGLL
jgi:hypothetical protein